MNLYLSSHQYSKSRLQKNPPQTQTFLQILSRYFNPITFLLFIQLIEAQTRMKVKEGPFQLRILISRSGLCGIYNYGAQDNEIDTFLYHVKDQSSVLSHRENFQHIFVNKNMHSRKTLDQLSQDYHQICQIKLKERAGKPKIRLSASCLYNQDTILYQKFSSNFPYLVLKDHKTIDRDTRQIFEGCPLQLGNTIKLGKLKLTVGDIKKPPPRQSTLMTENKALFYRNSKTEINQSCYEQQGQVKEGAICKKNEMFVQRIQVEQQDEDTLSKYKKKYLLDQQDHKEDLSLQFLDKPRKYSKLNQDLKCQRKRAQQEQILCRFCLLSGLDTEDDPFVAPCLCKGSSQMVHLSCLHEWINTKVDLMVKGEVQIISLLRPNCAVCRQPYPEFIHLRNKQRVSLVRFTKPEGPYMILHGLRSHREKPSIVYLIIPGRQEISLKLGRSPSQDIVLKEASISRKHCQFFYRKGHFYIRDIGSRFGSLLQFQKDREFDYNPVKLQFNQTLYQISHLNQDNAFRIEETSL